MTGHDGVRFSFANELPMPNDGLGAVIGTEQARAAATLLAPGRRPPGTFRGETMRPSRPFIVRHLDAFTSTRRSGVRERRLLGPSESPHQNLVLIDADAGATVEPHRVENSESFFVLAGELFVSGDGYRERLGPGDLCHFPPGHTHGVEVGDGPARFLVVFAPARAGE